MNTIIRCMAISILCLILICSSATGQAGKYRGITVHSSSLEGNPVNDSPDRNVTVYLPPGYDSDPDMRYPVVYLLHGYAADNGMWIETLNAMNSWIEEKRVKEMIVVAPNCQNWIYGSYYTNSAVGRWADFIAIDLVNYMDNNYRTLPQRESRAILGHSMGGRGAFTLGIFYPEVFGYMGCLAEDFCFDDSYMEIYKRDFAVASTIKAPSEVKSWKVAVMIGMCSGYLPNPDNRPFYCDFPFIYKDDGSGEIIRNQPAYDIFLSYSAVDLAEKYVETLLSMKAIYIDCGIRDDPYTLTGCRKLHEKLDSLGVEHVYEEFDGDHNCCVANSTGNALEVFSREMVLDVITGVEPAGKLTSTWGQIRR